MMAAAQNSLAGVTRALAEKRWVPLFGRLSILVLGAIHTWAAISAYSMNADGINYLDMGDAFWRGDWTTAINPVWSPLYAWLIGLAMRVVQPAMQWEFALAHLVDFAILIVTLLCFERFWRKLWDNHPKMAWAEWAWWGLGYALFAWAALIQLEIWAVTPDMLMAAFVLLAASLLVEIRQGKASRFVFVLFGLFLGLAYLTKAIMLPVSVVFLSVGAVSAVKRPLILLSVAAFLLVATPYIAAISQIRGHFTWGDAGTITYVRYVNGLPYPHWQGGPPENGYPIHPSRLVFETPPIYEFDGPIAGTYPISFDPVYWYEGVQTNLNWSQQISALLRSALFYFDIFGRQLGVWLALVLVLFGLRQRSLTRDNWRPSFANLQSFISQWGLIIPALAAFAAYAIVYVEGRYIAVFTILLMGELLAKAPTVERPAVTIASLIMIAFMLINIAAFNFAGAQDLSANLNSEPDAAQPPSWPGETAETLHQLGVQPGSKVGVIGYAFDSFWARLGGFQIVAEMLESEATPFWLADSEGKEAAVQAFVDTGIRAIVAESAPTYADMTNWIQVGNSNYYIYLPENNAH